MILFILFFIHLLFSVDVYLEGGKVKIKQGGNVSTFTPPKSKSALIELNSSGVLKIYNRTQMKMDRSILNFFFQDTYPYSCIEKYDVQVIAYKTCSLNKRSYLANLCPSLCKRNLSCKMKRYSCYVVKKCDQFGCPINRLMTFPSCKTTYLCTKGTLSGKTCKVSKKTCFWACGLRFFGLCINWVRKCTTTFSYFPARKKTICTCPTGYSLIKGKCVKTFYSCTNGYCSTFKPKIREGYYCSKNDQFFYSLSSCISKCKTYLCPYSQKEFSSLSSCSSSCIEYGKCF